MLEIFLVVLGLVIFTCSFLLPAGKKQTGGRSEQISEEAAREMVEKEVEVAKSKISDIVDETINYAMEKTERAMDRLTNEKMMAVNDYSDTVLEEINKSHKEVIFLYDMLNDKHENLKTTVSEAVRTATEVKQTVKDAEVTAKEAEHTAKEASRKAEAVREIAQEQDFAPLNLKEARVLDASVITGESKKESPEEEAEKKTEKKETGQKEAVKKETVRREAAEKKAAEKEAAGKEAAGEDAEQEKKPGRKPRKKTTSEPVAAEEVPEVAVSLNSQGRSSGRNSNERILELHKAGKSNMAIARELGLGIGEVKLVIDLFEGV